LFLGWLLFVKAAVTCQSSFAENLAQKQPHSNYQIVAQLADHENPYALILVQDTQNSPPKNSIQDNPSDSQSPPSPFKKLLIQRITSQYPDLELIYPGQIMDHKTRQTVYESKAYYGKCDPHVDSDVVLIFQKDHISKKRGILTSRYQVKNLDGLLFEELLTQSAPTRSRKRNKKTTSKPLSKIPTSLLKSQCHEIAGWKRTTEQKN
jgi:hypothetical protein